MYDQADLKTDLKLYNIYSWFITLKHSAFIINCVQSYIDIAKYKQYS